MCSFLKLIFQKDGEEYSAMEDQLTTQGIVVGEMEVVKSITVLIITG